MVYSNGYANGVQKWSLLSEPVQACTSVALTLTDRQQLQHDDERYVRIILRALPSFHIPQ